MSEPINLVEPRHPHERDGRNESPLFDAQGRCLVCCRDYADQLTAELAEAVAAMDAVRKSLTYKPVGPNCQCPVCVMARVVQKHKPAPPPRTT